MPLVIISNGSNKFHLAPLAVELEKFGALDMLLTAGWPRGLLLAVLRPMMKNAAIARYVDRRESISENKVTTNNLAEAVFQFSIRFRIISENFEQQVAAAAFRWYIFRAKSYIVRSKAQIYHFRACYGGSSITVASKSGMITLCDLSIAHPCVLEYMVEHSGAWPAQGVAARSPLNQRMVRDLRDADYVITNSDFVKKTCVHCGIPADKVFVTYWGVDSKFFNAIESTALNYARKDSLSVLYAGGLQRRKGIETLALASALLSQKIKFHLAGGMEYHIRNNASIAAFLDDTRVQYHGLMTRSGLAALMSQFQIFVFPSYCEGSARVIFEAMACGCFIITTENSGSIVTHGVHGLIVPAGEPLALSDAIKWATENPEEIEKIGRNNRLLIRQKYTQDKYCKNIMDVYNSIMQRGENE